MLSMLQKFKKNKIMYFLLILTLILMPFAVSLDPEADVKAIVLAIGFDKIGEQYEVSAQLLIPKYSEGFSENIKTVSADGENVSQAIKRISEHLGKHFAMEHCSTVIIGKEFANQDILKHLDFLFRGKKISGNTYIVQTNKTAKDLIKATSTISNSFSLSIDNLMQFNQVSSNNEISDINNFVRNYYSPTKISFAQIIDLVEEDSEGLKVEELSSNQNSSSSTQSSSGNQTSGQSGQEDKSAVIQNQNNVAVYKAGILTKILNEEQAKTLDFITGSSITDIINLTNINDDIYKNADASFSIRNKRVTKNIQFKNGKPRIYYNLKLIVALEEVVNGGQQKDFSEITKNYITEEVKMRISDYIRTNIGLLLNECKSENIDIFNFYSMLYKFKNKEFTEYLINLSPTSNYLDDIEMFVSVEVQGRN